MTASQVGSMVGQYKVVAELGRGQRGMVYKAWQQSLERYVALKVLHRHDKETLQKFKAEAQLTARLIQDGVPNIRQVYEVGQTADGLLFVALEFVNDSLSNVLQRGKEQKRQVDPSAAAKLLTPVAEALDAIHSLGWVHLDVKPENILISKGGRALLADFGIATRRGMITHSCTPGYASPEQAAGDRPVGPWSDIYSLGVVLYEMVAGHPPFRGDQDIVILRQHLDTEPPSARRFNSQLTVGQDRVILKALAKSPQERHRSAGAFVQAMQRSGNLISDVLEVPSSAWRATSSWRRLPRIALVGAFLALLLAILLLVGWRMGPRLPFLAPQATDLPATATVLPTRTPSALAPSATVTRPAVPTRTPTATMEPTSTLAATSTSTPRPSATPTAPPTKTPQPTSNSGP